MKINLFLSGGLSADYYNLCLGKEDIKEILVYLNTIMPVMEINNKCNVPYPRNEKNYKSIEFNKNQSIRSYVMNISALSGIDTIRIPLINYVEFFKNNDENTEIR